MRHPQTKGDRIIVAKQHRSMKQERPQYERTKDHRGVNPMWINRNQRRDWQ